MYLLNQQKCEDEYNAYTCDDNDRRIQTNLFFYLNIMYIYV